VTAEKPSDISRMRISDADRDQAASLLGNAMAEGRLTPQEHSERIDAVFAAKTQADIQPLVSDLPGAGAELAARTGSAELTPLGRPRRMVALLSEIRRSGRWQVPARIKAVTVLGGVHLDLREAVLPGREVEIRATCVLGGVEIIVPPEVHVVDDGWALVGGREVPPDSTQSARRDAPVLRIKGVSILGGISVRRKPREADDSSETTQTGDQ
jgi:hypothetical protein